MYNLSESLISFEVVENGSVVQHGQIPYDLLGHVRNVYVLKTNRLFRYTVLTSQFEFDNTIIRTAMGEKEDEPYTILSLIAVDDLSLSKEITDQMNKSAVESQLFQQTQDEESARVGQELMSAIASQSQIEFEENLKAQNLLTEKIIADSEAEAYRIDMLRMHTVTQIAVDPTSAVSALMSEVGHNLDVQRQIAAVLPANIEVAKTLISSTASLWNSSYDIMETLSNMAQQDIEIANLLVDNLPSDSSLAIVLKTRGLAS
jgi:hypothetical protein